LRIGLYQLRFLTRVPASAAVDESVKVQAARLSSARAFVNAVLRRATREPEYEPADKIADPVERLAVESSHPRWLIERWIASLGIEETKAFVRAITKRLRQLFELCRRVPTKRGDQPSRIRRHKTRDV
jgi:16S rRNA (cytosine967-C5)-methyltransferase